MTRPTRVALVAAMAAAAAAMTPAAMAAQCPVTLAGDPAGDQLGSPAFSNADLRAVTLDTSDVPSLGLRVGSLRNGVLEGGRTGLAYTAVYSVVGGGLHFIQASTAGERVRFDHGDAEEHALGFLTLHYRGTTTGMLELQGPFDGSRPPVVRLALPPLQDAAQPARLAAVHALVSRTSKHEHPAGSADTITPLDVLDSTAPSELTPTIAPCHTTTDLAKPSADPVALRVARTATVLRGGRIALLVRTDARLDDVRLVLRHSTRRTTAATRRLRTLAPGAHRVVLHVHGRVRRRYRLVVRANATFSHTFDLITTNERTR